MAGSAHMHAHTADTSCCTLCMHARVLVTTMLLLPPPCPCTARRYSPYASGTKKCKVCKSTLHQEGLYCHGCAYSKGARCAVLCCALANARARRAFVRTSTAQHGCCAAVCVRACVLPHVACQPP